MGKNNGKKEIGGESCRQIVTQVTKSLNKHGEIRGKNKQQTKSLRAACPHHKITNKGKIKPTIVNRGDGTCYCTMCNRQFTTRLFTDDELGKVTGNFRSVLDQARFMATAADLGKDTTEYLTRISVDASLFKKTYGRIKKVVQKSNDVRSKKNKNRSKGGGSESYGGWK